MKNQLNNKPVMQQIKTKIIFNLLRRNNGKAEKRVLETGFRMAGNDIIVDELFYRASNKGLC